MAFAVAVAVHVGLFGFGATTRQDMEGSPVCEIFSFLFVFLCFCWFSQFFKKSFLGVHTFKFQLILKFKTYSKVTPMLGGGFQMGGFCLPSGEVPSVKVCYQHKA